ncbi:invasion associated locus B family protein [Loktanella sp. M215]|uniref:invasion associated locus B family protein n=1 Tax=Loktanella sp. M215 TaxID=2675431 RepID=UPI001F2199DB|nr:invasion associated locus B family protein [Loktanella sp. M215]MCF7702494.1 hypothetical protein [Loktanella sp. M215]
MLYTDRCAAVFGLVLATLGASSLSAQERTIFDKANRTTVGDWAVECMANTESTEGKCQVYQRVLTQDPNTAAMVVALAWSLPKDALLAQISLPLGSDLTEPPLLSIDGKVAANFTWSRCVSSGCLVEAALPDALIAALVRGKSAKFTVVQPNGGEIAIPLSLTGLAEALDRIIPKNAMPAVTADDGG